MENRTRILVVCVNYQSDDCTARYLQSWAAVRENSVLDIVVVDNSERRGIFAPPPGLDLRIECVKPDRNLGYLGGANHGLQSALKRSGLPTWCIVSNVDVELPCPSFIERLIDLRPEPTLGMVAPRIISRLTGVDQNPFLSRRPSSARMRAYKYLYSSYPATLAYESVSRLYKRIKGTGRRAKSLSERRPIYAPHGSFLLFARKYFELGGNLEYPCFLFGEEIHLAEQVRKRGLQVVYAPEFEVVHSEHVSVGRSLSRSKLSYARAAAAFCADEYFSEQCAASAENAIRRNARVSANDILGVTVRDMTRSDLNQVAELHAKNFPGYFLTNLGEAFLRRYYAEFLGNPLDCALVAVDMTGVIGFCVGTQDKGGFFNRLYRKHFARMVFLVGFMAIVNPVIRRGLRVRADHILRACRARFRWKQARRRDVETTDQLPARLLSIAVANAQRGGGVAAELVEQFCARLRAKGATEVGLTVAPGNRRAIAFYVKTGWNQLFANRSQCCFCRSTKARSGACGADGGKGEPRLMGRQ